MYVPRYLFFTKGVGVSEEKLSSFENALCDAKIAHFNLVKVSSIFPPKCKILAIENGIDYLEAGQIVHCVLSRAQCQEPGRRLAASIGLAVPKQFGNFGYISEHHSFGQTEEEAGIYAKNIAISMLAKSQGKELTKSKKFDKKKELYELLNEEVNSQYISISTTGSEGNLWTTVVTAVLFIP